MKTIQKINEKLELIPSTIQKINEKLELIPDTSQKINRSPLFTMKNGL